MPGCASTPAWLSTSPTRTHPGSAAPMKTPAACSASTSPRAPTSAATPPATWPPLPPPPTPAPARHSAGRRPPKLSTSTLTPVRKAVLRRPVESALAAAIGVEDRILGERVVAGRHLDRLLDERGLVVIVGGPPDHRLRVAVDDGGQEKPALPCRDAGDIADHFLAGRISSEIPGHEVRKVVLLAVAVGEADPPGPWLRSEEHTSELQSLRHLVCRLL